MAAFLAAIFFFMRTNRTVETCFASAKLYESRSKFWKNDQASYAFLKKRNLLESACAHMKLSDRYSYKRWTAEEVRAVAKEYSSRSEFRRNNEGAYAFALKNNMLDKICSHMRPSKVWNTFELMCVAKKYDNVNAFRTSENEAYNYAVKSKQIRLATSHMSRHVISWTKELVLEEAKKHQMRGMFLACASGAYKHADKYGYLDEACAHMKDPEYGFSPDKTAVMYHLRIAFLTGVTLYKLGITNREVRARLKGMGIPEGATVDVLDEVHFPSGRDARIAEKRVHRQYKAFRYTGEPLLKNGNTELFHVPLL